MPAACNICCAAAAVDVVVAADAVAVGLVFMPFDLVSTEYFFSLRVFFFVLLVVVVAVRLLVFPVVFALVFLVGVVVDDLLTRRRQGQSPPIHPFQVYMLNSIRLRPINGAGLRN